MYREATAIESSVSPIMFLLQNASAPLVLTLLVLSAGLTVWGLVNVFFVRSPALLTLQALLSFVPGLLSIVGGFYAFFAFANLASAHSPEPPAAYAAVVSMGIACGIFGPLGSFLAGSLGILALAKVAFASREAPASRHPSAKPVPA
ncbi:MAG TPA: hypothetical protein VGN57_06270 [Pirellulaceae bacterium]|nr:hypothetical protein [Pirellulaceae bacterium]